MALLSPGIQIREFDFTQIVPTVSTSSGAFVGQFKWGPVEDVTIMSSEDTLVKRFGKPSDSNYIDWFSASNFLAYTNNLNLVRVIEDASVNKSRASALNATPDGPHLDITTRTGTKNLFAWSTDLTKTVQWGQHNSSVAKNTVTVGLPLENQGFAYDITDTVTGVPGAYHALGYGIPTNDGTTATLTYYIKPIGTIDLVHIHMVIDSWDKYGVNCQFILTGDGTATDPWFGTVAQYGNATSSITKVGSWYKIEINYLNLPEHTGINNAMYYGTVAAGFQRSGTITQGISLFAPQFELSATSTDYVMTSAPKDSAVELLNVADEDTLGTGLLVKNDNHFAVVSSSVENQSYQFVAKFAGNLGNSIAVSMADRTTFNSWKYKDLFDTAPSTSAFAKNLGSSNDELHVVVIDEDGLFTGTKGAILERFPYVSKAADARGVDNTYIFYGEVINSLSQYVRYIGPVVNSRLRGSTNIKEIRVTNGGSSYDQNTVTALLDGDGIDGKLGKISVVNGAIQTCPVVANAGNYVNLRWNRPLTDTLPVAADFKIPLVFSQTGGTTGTTPDAYALLNSSGIITSVTVVSGGTGWAGTVTAAIKYVTTGSGEQVIHGYTTDPLLKTTLHLSNPGAIVGLGAVTLSTGAIGSVAVANASTVFKIRSAVNYKMPLSFILSGAGTVGTGTTGYAIIGAFGQVTSIVITDPGYGWVGNVQARYWVDRGVAPNVPLPSSGFALTGELYNLATPFTWERQVSPLIDQYGLGVATPVNGAIRSVQVLDGGADYTYANIIFDDKSTSLTDVKGSGAAATVVLETGIASDSWAQNVQAEDGTPRRFKSLKRGYAGAFSFSGGSDGDSALADAYIKGWRLFANKEETDISLLISGDCGQYSYQSDEANAVSKYITEIAEKRMDCVAFLSPQLNAVNGQGPQDEKTEKVIGGKDQSTIASSYAVFDSGWKLQFDAYNNKQRKLPLNPDVAGLCAQTDYTNDTWWSPAGYTRGKIKNSITLLFNPDLTSRDELYKNNINPVVTFKGDGTILYGDRTSQGKSSAFSNINVRRLFIMLEKSIAKAAKYQLFEFNDQFTRSSFTSMIKSVLDTVKAKRGVTDFFIQCDSTNNTPDVIDRGEFVASIYIKPARSINFIQLNFVAVRTGVEFSTVVGQL